MTPEELTERLTGVMRDAVGDDSLAVEGLRRLSGGASRETWSFEATGQTYILQRGRGGSLTSNGMDVEAAVLSAASRAGVPVPPLVASGDTEDGLGAPFLISGFIEGETIARKILRDDEFETARRVLASQCGEALAAIHSVPAEDLPQLNSPDQVAAYRDVLDGYGDAHPTFELAFRWLEDNRPETHVGALVHGDFRLGNLMVGPDGLRAVIDWELAHIGDPMEDLGWLCVRAWRFGSDQPVAGVGAYSELFDAYGAASGKPVDPAVARWWEVVGTLKWGIMCITQARAHLDGWSRSMELAAIGRRVCENEHDLLLHLAPDALAAALAGPAPEPVAGEVGMHGRPTAIELLEAVKEWVEGDVRTTTTGRVQFHTRVAANVLDILRRELELGPTMADTHRERLSGLGVASERELADAIRAGQLDERIAEVRSVVAATVVDKLRVANPRHFVS